ncbi:MAG: zinc ribbon domain-containing protein, partial [Treponema sp.]|nr:zinc ribbon domain-containing protein [Treponema sp.]
MAFCSNCGSELKLDRDKKFCTKCGTAVNKPVKKPKVKAEPVATETKNEAGEKALKFRNLFDAYSRETLPFAQGYIVSSFFSETSNYSIYEIVSYAGVKEIFKTET